MGRKDISAKFPFEPRHIEVHGSRLHYIDEGEGDPVLFLHGNPTSSYLWRNVIPHLTPSARCIALDLIGMGKSDKPDIDYGFFDHVKFVEGFIEAMDLTNLTLVIHDWGSALGFHYAMRNQGNIKGIAFMEAIVKPMKWDEMSDGFSRIFKVFRTPIEGAELLINKNMFVEQILPGSVVRKLTEEEMDHYREPFLDPPTRKPVWKWPNELPLDGEPEDVNEAVMAFNKKLRESELPLLLFHATPGAIIRDVELAWCRQNLKNLKTVDIGQGIHFIQEDNPHLIGEEIAQWYKKI